MITEEGDNCMKVSPIANFNTTVQQVKYKNCNLSPKYDSSGDFFVKSNNISFKGEEKNSKSLKNKLETMGFVGVPVLLSITAGVLSAKSMEVPDDYSIDTEARSIESAAITADADDGIFVVKGTPINLDASRFDYADVENGIYRNFDGSVDIDLLNGKYVDTQNGIFVDPESKISAFIDEDGDVKHFPLISFGNQNGCLSVHDNPLPMDDVPNIVEDGLIETGLHAVKGLWADIFGTEGEGAEVQDLFGRELVEAVDEDGETYLSVTPANFEQSSMPNIHEFIEDINDKNFQDYIDEHYPQFGGTDGLDADDAIDEVDEIEVESPADNVDTDDLDEYDSDDFDDESEDDDDGVDDDSFDDDSAF